MTSSYGKRVGAVVAGALIVCVLIGLYVGVYLVNVPGSASAQVTSTGTQLYLATVPAAATDDPHSTWVSYYAVDQGATNWRHVTTYVLPANTVVHVTIYQYDSASGLRNEFYSQVSGTQGGTFVLNGKTLSAVDPTTASHLFAVPQIGLSVPLQGISSSAKNPCSNAPCSLSNDHTTIQFSFRTPGKGLYRWQCFVPCAAGYIEGLGGPMQTVGYMDGYLKVI